MTDPEFAAQVLHHLERTTVSYPRYQTLELQGKYGTTTPEWRKALNLLHNAIQPPPTNLTAPAWTMRIEPNQTDPTSGPGNRYTYTWVKSRRPDPTSTHPQHQVEGTIRFDQYPDEFVMVESKRFDLGRPGRTTNFHLAANETAGTLVSPLALDWREGPRGAHGLHLKAEPMGGEWHYTILTSEELEMNRNATWTFEWHIRWRRDPSGYVRLVVRRNSMPHRDIYVPMQNVYADQRYNKLYCWLGAYESNGVNTPAQITQTLDYRGTTLTEALKDTPIIGSIEHSVSTTGGRASSVEFSPDRLPLGAGS